MGKILEKKASLGNLTLFISIPILIMAYYKYGQMLYSSFSNISLLAVTFTDIIVPLGMSFIIFESISYLVDIYKNEAKAGTYLDTLLFFLFFPKVTSGPIVLWRDFAPQLRSRQVSIDMFFSGIERIMIGFAKKAIIADTLGATVLKITTNATSSGIDWQTAVLGAVLYFLQIYYDFSAYSDIAIGISRLFGFDFKENFNYPYTATSLGEFWRRWHISLGTWFRTYIYIPLGGNRKNIYLNLFIVFMTTGIWHGSTINFVLWGFAHAIVIMLERYVRDKKFYIAIPSFIKWLGLMIFIMITWIIFMLPELWQAKVYYLSMLGQPKGNIYFTYEYFLSNKIIFITIIALIGAFIGKWKYLDRIRDWSRNTFLGLVITYLILLICFILGILFMINSTYSPFLYFQF
ncbi:MAG: MBOAT family O-acyltransferase [Gemella sp.]|nr:MBOAT family O-acyltransferase [Gemella sp.]